MSLVDYAASSDEDEPQTFGHHQLEETVEEGPSLRVPKDDQLHSRGRMSRDVRLPSSKHKEIVSDQSSELKLPDAAFLLNSPAVSSDLLNASDHSSRVAAAMAESAVRKRDLNGSSATYPRKKLPKGDLRHPKNVPDTSGGHLLPPQLAGRSNIVTEDISKLFVRKSTNS